MDIIFCKLIASFNEIYIYPISGQTTNQSRGLTSGHCRPKISDLDWHLSNNNTLKAALKSWSHFQPKLLRSLMLFGCYCFQHVKRKKRNILRIQRQLLILASV